LHQIYESEEVPQTDRQQWSNLSMIETCDFDLFDHSQIQTGGADGK
jgi:hypothetical protein